MKTKRFYSWVQTKKRNLFVILMLLTASHLWADQGYAVYDSSLGTFTFTCATPSETLTLGVDYWITDNTGVLAPEWRNISASITKVVFESSYANARPKSCTQWFSGFTNLTEIEGLNYLNTSESASLSGMFANCSSLPSLDVSNWNTSNVTTMNSMFSHCSRLTSLDVSNWNTENVGNMSSMFSNCNSLLTLTFGANWNTGNVTSMEMMFDGCSSLTSLDLSNCTWNTAKVKKMGYMFRNCSSLTSLDVSNWNTANVENMSSMFIRCSRLTSLDVSNWNTVNVKNMYCMFSDCNSLAFLGDLNVSKWKTGNVTSMQSMFSGCSSLTALNVVRNDSIWDTSKVNSLVNFFRGCSSLTSLDVSNWNSGGVTNMSYMFDGCSSLTSLKVSGLDTHSNETMYHMFSGCSSLTTLDVSSWNTENVKNMSDVFSNCSSLATLDVSSWDTGNVTSMGNMFNGCSELASLILDNSKWKTDKVTSMRNMFTNCSKLTTIDVSSWNTANVTDMYYMFWECNSLTALDVSSWNTANVTNMTSMFNNCSSLTSLDVSNWNSSSVTSMSGMFRGCSNLTSLTFGKDFITDNVASSTSMFYFCPKLRYIDFYTSNDADAITEVDRSADMFYGVPRTTVIYLPHGSSSVTDVENVVYTGNDPMAGGGSHGGGAQILKCPNYYSEDKVDIEFPRDFKTNKAEYSRAMSTTYGSVVLPYAFKTNADIQAYTLDAEHTETMYFVDAETIPAHTPFAFKKLGNAEFVMEDATGNFGITVKATQTTSAAEGGAPYAHTENLGGWTTKGYYVNETVGDYDGTFYIAGDKFYKADDALTMYPHRVTFHGAWETEPTTETPARFFEIATISKPEEEQTEEVPLETDDRELADAIEAADLRKEVREALAIYDAQGRMQNELKKGLNIIRRQDGTVRKVFLR